MFTHIWTWIRVTGFELVLFTTFYNRMEAPRVANGVSGEYSWMEITERKGSQNPHGRSQNIRERRGRPHKQLIHWLTELFPETEGSFHSSEAWGKVNSSCRYGSSSILYGEKLWNPPLVFPQTPELVLTKNQILRAGTPMAHAHTEIEWFSVGNGTKLAPWHCKHNSTSPVAPSPTHMNL